MKHFNGILSGTLKALVSLMLMLCFTLTPIFASTPQIGLVELLELALEVSPQVVEAELELEKAYANLQISVGRTKLQATFDGKLGRGYTTLPELNMTTVDNWNASITSGASTYLPTGAQLSLLAEWKDFKTLEEHPKQGNGEPSYTVQVNQPLFRPISTQPLWQGIRLNENALQQKEIELVKTRRDVALAVLEGYLTAWERQQQLASIERRLVWATQESVRVEQDLIIGDATQLDSLESNLRHGELTIELQVASMNYARALEDLFQIAGVETVDIKLEELPDIEIMSVLGFSNLNPEIELAQLAVVSNEYSYNATKAENKWQSSIQGYYGKDGNWQLSLNVQVPLFDSKVAANQEQFSQLQLQQSRSSFETLVDRLQQQQQRLIEDIKIVADRLQLAEESLSLAELRKEIVNIREELGAVSFTERYNAVEQWETAYLRLVSLKKQYQLLEVQAWFFQ